MAVDEKGAPLPSADHLPRKRIVVFVDILGFRDLITRMPTDPDLYSRVGGLLKTIQQKVEDHYSKGQPSRLYGGEDPQIVPQMAHFSDSIVMSFPLYDFDLPAALAILLAQELTIKLLVSGVFIRGGIASGWTYHEQNMLFGAGIIAAYELENRIAHVPRILVAEEVVGLLSDDNAYIREQYLGQDSDGCWFIKPFSGFLGGRLPQEMQNDSSFRDKVVEQFECTREHIQKELARAKDKGPDRLAKYGWLANQFNAAVKEIFQDMNISVDPIEVSCRP